jgi:predicted nucleic acid-binding protein
MAHYVEAAWDQWRAAADLGRSVAANGHKLPLSDLILAAVVTRCNSWIYTTDPDFDVIPDPKPYWPPSNH